MSPAPPTEGLRSDALRAALATALSGRPAPLEDLFARYGRAHDSRPNLKLAAAFGAEIGALAGSKSSASGAAAALLDRLGAADAAPDDPRVFLPIAAAHGWVALARANREANRAWAALAELAGDERTPVRLGALDALLGFAARPGAKGADALVARATEWLELEDREVRFGAAAVVVEVFGDKQSFAALADPEALLVYLSQALAEIAGAPRAAERSDGRRRLLLSLPKTLGGLVAGFGGGGQGVDWLERECTDARHPDVRDALSNVIVGIVRSQGTGATIVDRLRLALTGSAKPPRDPTRIRPGVGRNKAARRMR